MIWKLTRETSNLATTHTHTHYETSKLKLNNKKLALSWSTVRLQNSTWGFEYPGKHDQVAQGSPLAVWLAVREPCRPSPPWDQLCCAALHEASHHFMGKALDSALPGLLVVDLLLPCWRHSSAAASSTIICNGTIKGQEPVLSPKAKCTLRVVQWTCFWSGGELARIQWYA